MFEMRDEYLTGIKLIDDEHRELFRIANEAYEVLSNDFIADKFDNIVALIKRLKDYTAKHFADEEAYMESIQYKRMFTQKIEHTAFIEKLDELDLDQIDENQADALVEMIEFLGNWLIHHILEKDKLIGK
jgi:hemerythrin